MPTADSAEIYRRLNAVEQATKVHEAECEVRNSILKDWMATRVEQEKATAIDLHEIKVDRAKMVGAFMAISTLASALGSAGVIALFKAFGGAE